MGIPKGVMHFDCCIVASIIRSGINGNESIFKFEAVQQARSVASIIRSGINGNGQASQVAKTAGVSVASIIRSGINGNQEFCIQSLISK